MTDEISLDSAQNIFNVPDCHSYCIQFNSATEDHSIQVSAGSSKYANLLTEFFAEESDSSHCNLKIRDAEAESENIRDRFYEVEETSSAVNSAIFPDNSTFAQADSRISHIQDDSNVHLSQTHSIISTPTERTFHPRMRSIISSLSTYLRSIDNIESKLILIRTINITVFIAVLFLTALLSADGVVPFTVFRTIVYSCLGFVIIENLVRVQCTQRSTCEIHEDKLNIFDAMIAIVWTVCMTNTSTLSSLITVASSIALPVQYYLLTKTTGNIRMYGTKMRAFYAVKVVLLVVQIDQGIDLKWRAIFLEVSKKMLTFYIPIVVYGVIMIFSNVTNIVQCTVLRKSYKPQHLRQFFFSAYFCSNYAMSYIIAGYIVRTNKLYEEINEAYSLRIITIIGICMCLTILVGVFLTHYILIQNGRLLSVIQLFIECDDEEAEIAVSESVSSLVGHPKIIFKVILQNQYFIKNSESYYVPIATDGLLKDMSIRKPQTERLERQQENESRELCYVCCSDLQNAVFMTCGHGGICYNCARTCISQKPQCTECRAPVEGIALIDEEANLKGVFRSDKLTRVVIEYPPGMDEKM